MQTGRIDDVMAADIEPSHFIDASVRAVYETCVEHRRTWASNISADALRRQHPDFKVVPVTDDLAPLIAEFKDDRAVKFAEMMLLDLADEIAVASEPTHDRYREARKSVVETVMERTRMYAARIPSHSVSWLSDMDKRIVVARRQQEEGVLPGARIGIPQLNDYVNVVRAGEYVAFCGYSGKGKTTGMVRSSASAYAEGEQVLMISLEMSEEEVWEIFDAQAASLSRTALRKRELGVEDYGRYEEAAARVKERTNDIGLVTRRSMKSPTVDRLAALVEKHRPDVLAVDYISLMAGETNNRSDHERVMGISRDLKSLASIYGIKVYVAAQNNREAATDGPTESNIAYSISIFQDCDVMVGFHQDAEMERIEKVQVRLIKNRGGAKGPPGGLHALGYGLFEEHWRRDVMEFTDWTPAKAWAMRMAAE